MDRLGVCGCGEKVIMQNNMEAAAVEKGVKSGMELSLLQPEIPSPGAFSGHFLNIYLFSYS